MFIQSRFSIALASGWSEDVGPGRIGFFHQGILGSIFIQTIQLCWRLFTSVNYDNPEMGWFLNNYACDVRFLVHGPTNARSRFSFAMRGGHGKSHEALLLEIAIRCAMAGLYVLIICPTGTNVYSFKSLLPEFAGVDKIRVDTIQGVLNYKRSGSDSKVTWSPPSAMRRISPCTSKGE